MTLALTVGRTYRGKKPGRIAGRPPLVNDRTIKWIGIYELQYDGPSVANGRKFPRISIEKFHEWADRDVTDELPAGEYAAWPPVRQHNAQLATYAAGPADLSAPIDDGTPDMVMQFPSLRTPADILDWLQRQHTLHRAVHAFYVGDGYVVQVTHDDYPIPGAEWRGKTLQEAYSTAMAHWDLTHGARDLLAERTLGD